MRVGLAVTLVLLLAGCGAPRPDHEPPPTALADIPTATDAGTPGLYDLSPEEGLVPLDDLPGLTRTAAGEGASYRLDVPEMLLDNAEVLLLVQALEEQDVRVAYDVDLPFDPKLPLADPNTGNDMVCLGTQIVAAQGEHGFYFDRAAGRDGLAPSVNEYGAYEGHAIGHATAGGVDFLQQLYGPRFQHAQEDAFQLPAGAFLRLANGISQYPAMATQGEDRHWVQEFTFTGAHRVIRIPSAPLYCASGFGEFEDATQAGQAPFEVTQGGRRSIETRYGSQVAMNLFTPRGDRGPDPNPANSASVRFLDEVCGAGPGKSVVRSSFDAGTVAIEVDQWIGHPIVILTGMALGQGVISIFDEPSCQP